MKKLTKDPNYETMMQPKTTKHLRKPSQTMRGIKFNKQKNNECKLSQQTSRNQL